MPDWKPRQYQRVQLHVRVALEAGSPPQDNRAENIGLGGMCLASPNPQPLGTPVRLEICFPDAAEHILVDGVVIWTQAEVDGRMGIRFEPLDERTKRKLSDQLFRKGKEEHEGT